MLKKTKKKKRGGKEGRRRCISGLRELLRLALLSKDLNTLNTTTNQTRLSEDGEVKQLQRGGEEFREILMNTTKNNNNTYRCSVIVLVFSMENCQPCAQSAPKIDRLARGIKIYTLDS